MNYLEFAKHLSALFQAKYLLFRFEILATGTVSAEAASKDGKTFAFSISNTGNLTILATPKDALTASISTINVYISDSWTGQVATAVASGIENIEHTISLLMLNFTTADAQRIGGNIQSVVQDIIVNAATRDAQTIQTQITSLSALTATLTLMGDFVEFEIADITALTSFLAGLSARDGQEITLDLDTATNLTIVGSSAGGVSTPFNIGGQGTITISALLYRYATLGDYENTTLATMENQTLGDLEYIIAA